MGAGKSFTIWSLNWSQGWWHNPMGMVAMAEFKRTSTAPFGR
jgi:hypothetical protein